MQSDSHSHSSETSPVPPSPSSPPLSSVFHRHHPLPAPTPEAGDPSSPLRYQAADTRTVLIHVQTPFSDVGSSSSGKKGGWPVRWDMTVLELKREIAHGGLAGDEKWEGEGMRLVWQGRIARDEEKVGEIVGNARDPSQVHTFHLVARRITSPTRRRDPSLSPPRPEPTDSSTRSLPSSLNSHNLIALRDTIHYVLFTARHHLCFLLSAPTLSWDGMTPPPIIEQCKAREAVMTVIRAFADERGNREIGWDRWEDAFEGDDRQGLEEFWSRSGEREGVEQEIRSIWASRVGRQWKDGNEGEVVSVELDDIPYHLHLPPLKLMSSTQLTHLLVYLRISSLLPLLNAILDLQSHPTPTPTLVIQNPAARVIYQRSFRIHLPRIPASVLTHMIFSAVKVLGMMWMLTRDMQWDDVSLWIIGGGALGWWLGDAMNRYHQERRRIPTTVPPPAVDAGRNANVGADIPAQVAAEAPMHARVAARANRQRVPPGSSILTSIIPLVHLDTDARQLGLPGSSRLQYMGNPGADRGRAAPIQQSPPWWKTQFCLPIFLWIVTLIPEWEALRARAIRRRERAMRVLVGELSASAASTDTEPASEGQDPPRILPEGLGPKAKAYYERVMERGEGIDWEEEREAQRALGEVQDEPEEGGLGVRML